MFGTLLAVVLLVAGIIILFKTVRMVPQGYEWTVEAFGRYTHEEIASLMQRTPSFSKSQLARGGRRLRDLLEAPAEHTRSNTEPAHA